MSWPSAKTRFTGMKTQPGSGTTSSAEAPRKTTSASSRRTSTATAGSTSPWEQAGVRPTPQNLALCSGWGETRREPGKFTRSIIEEPSLHRLRWGDVKGTGKKQLVVAALQGRGTKPPNWGAGQGVRVLVYDVPEDPVKQTWPVEIADETLHTVHNLQLVDVDGDHRDELVLACWEGVFLLDRGEDGKWTRTKLGSGNQESTPNKGASEVKVGWLESGFRYIATIEPWHGNQVVVYTRDATSYPGARTLVEPGESARRVIAEPLQWGHAVWCANLDADKDDELIIGQRDPNSRSDTERPRAGHLCLRSQAGYLSSGLRSHHRRRWRHGL